jgi:hypothetical protein
MGKKTGGSPTSRKNRYIARRLGFKGTQDARKAGYALPNKEEIDAMEIQSSATGPRLSGAASIEKSSAAATSAAAGKR